MFDAKTGLRPGQNKDFQFRLLLFVVFSIFSFFILIIVIGNIQIAKYLSYKKKSENIREKSVRIPPIRGKIFSSDGYLLADNITSFNIYITPGDLYKDKILRQKELIFTSKALNYGYHELEKLLIKAIKNEEILIAENIDIMTFIKIKENIDNLPGISYKEVLYRYYPNNDILSHVLGHIGPISPNELAIVSKEAKYEQSDYIGKNGVEKYYESYLRGKPGLKVYHVDAARKILNEIHSKEIKPEPGNELELTINLKFQKIVEDILADRPGTIIALKPATGEIIAMASYPDYDPNIYILKTKENNIKKRKILLETKFTPLINRNIQSIYPPASIFKLVTATAILNENLISPTKGYNCYGIYRLGRRNFKCWVHPASHGWQTLKDGIRNSCDVYFYNAGLTVGPERINKYAFSYGFGNQLGIDLPFEKTGIIPSPKWLEENKGEPWMDGHTLITTIGQGDVKVTPLQIANFMSVICNKGYSYKPHLIKSIKTSNDGKIISKIEPQKIVKTTYNESVYNFLHNSLESVTKSGTARGAYYANPFRIAGKTGTAEIGTSNKKQTHSWFAGFGPLDYPIQDQIVVVVLIEYENNEYLRYAAPIASMVFNSWLSGEDFKQSAKRIHYPYKESYIKDNNNEN